jgi:hypothetical protein
MMLYAIWAPVTYHNVTYDFNGGYDPRNPSTDKITDYSLRAGSKYTIKTKEQIGNIVYGHDQRIYRIFEWNTKADGSGTGYKPGAVITITGDMVLYAIWEVVSEVVYISNSNSNSGDPYYDNAGSMTPYTVKSPNQVKIIETDTSGHFIKWNTQPDGSGTDYYPGDVIPTVTGGMQLYAIRRR